MRDSRHVGERVLEVRDLAIAFRQGGASTLAVRGVSFDLHAGETLAIVGESGSGKSVTALSTVKLLADNAEVSGSVRYKGTELLAADERTLRRVRVEDAQTASRVFDLLMGSDVAPRKEFIVAGSAGLDRERIDA